MEWIKIGAWEHAHECSSLVCFLLRIEVIYIRLISLFISYFLFALKNLHTTCITHTHTLGRECANIQFAPFYVFYRETHSIGITNRMIHARIHPSLSLHSTNCDKVIILSSQIVRFFNRGRLAGQSIQSLSENNKTNRSNQKYKLNYMSDWANQIIQCFFFFSIVEM